MSYTVVWKPTANQKLAQIWLHSPDRAGITRAAHLIDRLLKSIPWTTGESRSGSTRLLIMRPLVVAYEIVEDDRRVEVLSVRAVPGKP